VKTDASGHALTLPRAPRRIVSLVPSITETLFALGLGDAIAGVTAYCVEPRDAVRGKPKVGGQKDPKLDVIRGLAPDLVVANLEENLEAHVSQLRAWGVPVWVTYPRTVEQGIAMIRELGELTGTHARAAELAGEIDAQLADTRARTAARGVTDVFYPIWRGPYMTVGGDTYIHDMLALCGGRNVFGGRSERYPVVSLGDVAAARPAVILLPDEPFRFRRIHLQDFAAYPDIPAVRENRVHLVDGKLFCWYGPRIGEALRAIPTLLE
jgi:ABC-type Fe3+-hydroxamate transport system substrate-binding protein